MWEHERKLQRAAQHFEQLEAQVRGWEQGQGYTVRTVPWPDPPHYLVRAEVVRPVEDEPFPLVLGDFVQNARAALDYIAGALGDIGAGGAMSDRDAVATMFPITRSPQQFAQVVERRLPTSTHPVRTAIEDLQPYKTGGVLWASEPLWILNELARFDRHRFLHVGCERIGMLELDWARSSNIRSIENLRVTEGPFSFAVVDGLEEAEMEGGDDTAILAALDAFPIDPGRQMHMEWQQSIEIGFSDDRLPSTLSHLGGRWPPTVPMALRNIQSDIHEVFAALAPFLPKEPPPW